MSIHSKWCDFHRVSAFFKCLSMHITERLKKQKKQLPFLVFSHAESFSFICQGSQIISIKIFATDFCCQCQASAVVWIMFVVQHWNFLKLWTVFRFSGNSSHWKHRTLCPNHSLMHYMLISHPILSRENCDTKTLNYQKINFQLEL